MSSPSKLAKGISSGNLSLTIPNNPTASLSSPDSVMAFFNRYLTMLQGDARYSLRFALLLCSVLAILGIVIVHFFGETDYRLHHTLYESHNRKQLVFQYAIMFSLVVSLPVILDMAMTYFTTKDSQEFMHPREFSRRFVMVTIVVPNIFIASKVIPAGNVDLIMYYQFCLCYLTMVYRLYTLTSAQKVVCFSTLKEIYGFVILSAILGFLYELTIHNVIQGRHPLRVMFAISMVLSQLMAAWKVTTWLKTFTRISSASSQNIQTSRATMYALIFALLICLIMMFVHLIGYDEDVMFFPGHFESYYCLEWVFSFTLLIWTTLRNFEVRKSEISIRVRLHAYYNKYQI